MLRCISNYYKDKLAALVAQNSAKNARERLFKHIAKLPYNYHVNSNTGDIIQRCTSDIETIQNFLYEQYTFMGQILFTIVYVIGIMAFLNVKYMVLSVLLVPIILIYTNKFFHDIQKVFKDTDEAEGRLTSTVHESLNGIRVVRAFATEEYELEKFDKSNKDYRDNIKLIIKLMSRFWSLTDILCLLQGTFVIIAGIYFAYNNAITIGTILAFLSYSDS